MSISRFPMLCRPARNRVCAGVVLALVATAPACRSSAFSRIRAATPMAVVDHTGRGRGVAGGVSVVGEDALFKSIDWQWTVGLGSGLAPDSSNATRGESEDDSIDFVLATGPVLGDPDNSWFSIGPVGFIDPRTGEADWGGMVSLFISLDSGR